MIRYWLALLIRSQRFFPPLLFELAGVTMLTANGTGSLIDAYGSCSAVVFLAASWLTICLIGIEDPAQLAIVAINGRGLRQVVIGAVAVAVLAVLSGVVIGLLIPALAGQYHGGSAAISVGALGQFGAGLVGIAVGLLCSRWMIRPIALALGVAVLLSIAAFVVRWLTPLNEVLRLQSNGPRAAAVLAPLAGLTLLAAAMVAAVTAVVHQVAGRRD